MPIYEFVCKKCGEEFEYTLSISERKTKKVKCSSCKSTRVDQTLSTFYANTSRKS
jgi:putative FmdB family regulatory protein